MCDVTVYELIELAKLGREYVQRQQEQNVIAWVGHLPSSEDLDEAGERISRAFGGDGTTPGYVIYDI